MNAIKVKNLKKTLGKFTLDIENLNIKKGFITGFIGENGAGKTTTIKLLMGMLTPDVGSIEIFNKNLTQNNIEIKESIGYVGDLCGYLKESPIKLIKKNIAPFFKNWDENFYRKYIKKFSIDENKKYMELSHGKKKQFELTMALSHHPKLLIMDEPTANLDPIIRNDFLDILLDYMQNDEITIFYSSHITSDLEKTCDYIIFIHNGKIILNEEKELLMINHTLIKGKNELIDKETKKCFVSIKTNAFGFEGLCANKNQAFELFGQEVIYEKPSLENIMMYYIRRNNNE
ncbi:ABC transporter ATP-binding protein [Clostridium tarantellae]|uniref:ATP-binding cassette domain-containing protein n=1 Tax=Clostridium tarantellae TaxID=39493 RepID=A0A6I1MHF6_9CLOT|nr:ABC transporter ATP-binding protein [Clostridium tarantellae]MPQ42193.1 ATP-binding cassette domain-containing protein [Clostridium tarantellae]